MALDKVGIVSLGLKRMSRDQSLMVWIFRDVLAERRSITSYLDLITGDLGKSVCAILPRLSPLMSMSLIFFSFLLNGGEGIHVSPGPSHNLVSDMEHYSVEGYIIGLYNACGGCSIHIWSSLGVPRDGHWRTTYILCYRRSFIYQMEGM